MSTSCRCNHCNFKKVHHDTANRSGHVNKNGAPCTEVFFAKCSNCDAKICSNCMVKFCLRATPDARNHPWSQELHDICTSGPQRPMAAHLGNCCKIKEPHNAAKCEKDNGATAHNAVCRLSKKGQRNIGGFLHFPQPRIVLDSPNDSIDIHGLDCLGHCVPSEECVANMAM